jgi:hypothetical protein
MSQAPSYIAQKGKAASAEVEVLGQTMVAFIENLRADEVKRLMALHGLNSIDPNTWYPQQLFLDIYQTIEDEHGEFSEYLVAIGVKTIDTVPLPEGVDNIAQAVGFLHGIYTAIHRNLPEGEGWTVDQVNEHFYRIGANFPYPPAATYGYLFAFARRFAPKGMRFTVSSPITEAGKPTRFDVRFHT